MKRGLPIGPTLLVFVALPILIALGIWQFHRAEWKEALLAQLAANSAKPVLDLPAHLDPALGFRRVRVACDSAKPSGSPSAGRTATGIPGYRHLLSCEREGGEPVLINIGIATDPKLRPTVALRPAFTGVLVPRDGHPIFVLVAEQAPPPLQPAAPPTVDEIPNNHLAYAGQWFFFALALLGVYGFYVRQWRRA